MNGNDRIDAADFGELTIHLDPKYGMVQYVGTRLQLEAEGIVPSGMKWPDGYAVVRWESGQFEFWMRRQRPEGAKGPRRAFLDVDNWCVGVNPKHGRSCCDQKIRMMKLELARLQRYNSPQGIAESKRQWERIEAASNDEKFQRFKSLVPGLVQPPRSRAKGARVDGVRHE